MPSNDSPQLSPNGNELERNANKCFCKSVRNLLISVRGWRLLGHPAEESRERGLIREAQIVGDDLQGQWWLDLQLPLRFKHQEIVDDVERRDTHSLATALAEVIGRDGQLVGIPRHGM